MAGVRDAEIEEYLAAVATARVVFGPGMRIQVPPNLSDPSEFALLLRAGADDWGGVSPLTVDHVNPERPWPSIVALASATAAAGFELRERLTAHPEYVRAADEWIDPAVRPAVAALAASDGLATRAIPGPRPSGAESPAHDRIPLTPLSREQPPANGGSGRERRVAAASTPVIDGGARHSRGGADAHPAEALLATGDALEELVAEADAARRFTVGEPVTLVVNRNIASSGFRARGVEDDEPGAYGPEELAAMVADAAALGATEVCIQGLLPASEPASGYLDIARIVKQAAPSIHLHAFRPADIDDLAVRGGLGLSGAVDALREAGVDTVPGTGVKLLDEALRLRVAPDDLPVARWEEVIRAAHTAGLRGTSVIFYGHVESAHDRVRHLERLLRIQEETGGFTEFVPIPLPAYTSQLVPGRAAIDEHRAMVAVSRLVLGSAFRHVQIPWTRVGLDAAGVLLRAGGDDLGGTLLDGRVRPDAGAEAGLELPVAEAEAIARRLMRPFRLRTTTYGTPPVRAGVHSTSGAASPKAAAR